MFPLFLERTADILAPRLGVAFRQLLRFGCFPACCRLDNVTIISKGPPSSSVANYRPISLSPILSKVFERRVSVRLGRFMECWGVLPTTQFAYRKESTIHRGNHQGILFKLCSVGVGDSLLSILTKSFSDGSQYIVVDGCRCWFTCCQEFLREAFWVSS